jgi:hypothetical protein
MNKSILLIIFAFVMLTIGIFGTLSPYNVRSFYIKIMELMAESSSESTRIARATIPSIRIGGAIGILIGAFLLWSVFRNK